MFLLGHTNIFHCEQTEAITLFPTNRMRILQKFSVSMTDFLLLNTLLEIKSNPQTNRNSKKTTTFAFNKRYVTYLRKYPIIQHLVSDSGHSIKGQKRGGTTRICKTMKYNGLQLSPHSVYFSKQRLYRLK